MPIMDPSFIPTTTRPSGLLPYSGSSSSYFLMTRIQPCLFIHNLFIVAVAALTCPHLYGLSSNYFINKPDIKVPVVNKSWFRCDPGVYRIVNEMNTQVSIWGNAVTAIFMEILKSRMLSSPDHAKLCMTPENALESTRTLWKVAEKPSRSSNDNFLNITARVKVTGSFQQAIIDA